MYNVIIVLDDSRDRSYYHSYVTENGNIVCAELPPYADTNKARACYWDGKKWVFDADKYAEIVAVQTAEKEAAEKAATEAEAVPTNQELADAMMEIANDVSILMDAVAELGITSKGGE